MSNKVNEMPTISSHYSQNHMNSDLSGKEAEKFFNLTFPGNEFTRTNCVWGLVY